MPKNYSVVFPTLRVREVYTSAGSGSKRESKCCRIVYPVEVKGNDVFAIYPGKTVCVD